MRVVENIKAAVEKTASVKKGKKINWPDLEFGPVNLWTLPPAWFFYRKVD